MQSRRPKRVASLIRNLIAEVIQRRLSDPRIESLTSITRVEMSPDLLVAKVYVSVMAPPPRRRLTLQALEHASKRIRGLVGEQLALRQVPELLFRLDEGLQDAVDTIELLDRIERETQSREPDAADAPATDTPHEDSFDRATDGDDVPDSQRVAPHHFPTHEDPSDAAQRRA